jgi:hypothetical protein
MDARPVVDRPVLADYFVALVDILGQSRALEKIARPARDEDAEQTLQKNWTEVANTIANFRELFVGYFDRMQRHIEEVQAIPERAPVLEEVRRNPTQLQGFSDTVVVFAPLEPEFSSVAVGNVYNALHSCALTSIVMLSHGHPVRGGIAKGYASEIFRGEIYGPALHEAHALEQDVANWPRIVVSEELIAYLRSWEGRKPEGVHEEFSHRFSRLTMSFLMRDPRGVWMLDFLGDGVRSTIPPPIYEEFRDKHVRKAYTFVEVTLSGLVRCGDSALIGKYVLLGNYIRERVPKW